MNYLTELTIKQAKPKIKQYKLFDGGGMFLLVHPNGSKYWRMKFSFERKSKLASFGVWPDVSLKDAREKRYEAKKKIKDGINPVDEKRQERQHKRIGSGPREYELPSLNECRFFFAEKYSLDTDIFEIG